MGNQNSSSERLIDPVLIVPDNIRGLIKEKEALVISSGGIYLFDMMGFFNVWKNNGLLDSFRVFIGVSAGAIVTTMLTSPTLNIHELSLDIINEGFFPDNFQQIRPINLYHFARRGYLSINSNLKVKLIKTVLKKAFGDENITFRRHYELTGKLLIISLANITDENIYNAHVFNSPDVKLFDILDGSTSIPYVWSPRKINIPGLGEKYFVDGAVVNNYPINLLIPECSRSALKIPREIFDVPTLSSGKVLGMRVRGVNTTSEDVFYSSYVEENPVRYMNLIEKLRIITQNTASQQDSFLTKKVLDNTIIIENLIPTSIIDMITNLKAVNSFNNGGFLATELLAKMKAEGKIILN